MDATPPRPEADPRTFHQLARRDQLVTCALRVVARDGVGALSVSAVAREAGVSRGVVSYNVGDLPALLHEVVALVYTRGRDAVGPAVAAATDPAAAIEAFAGASLDFYVSHRSEMEALRAVFASGALHRDDTPDHAREREETSRLVTDGQRAGVVCEGDPTMIAEAVRAVLDVASRRIAEGAAADDVRREVTAMVARMVAPT